MKINFSNKTFSFFLILSLSFHFIVILFFILSKSLPNPFKKNKNILIQNSIRIDSIGLPDLPSKPKAKAKPKVKTVAIPKKQKEKKEPVKKKKNNKKSDKQTKKQKTNQEKKNTNSTKNEELKKGNKLSQGTKEGKENLTSQQLSKITLYANHILSQTRTQWKLPNYLINKNLTAQVEIKINELGRIDSKNILISSNNKTFDDFVLEAITNAEPYPKPPADIQSFIKGGIVLNLSSD